MAPRPWLLRGSCDGNAFRDRWGHIHARRVHPSFYDPIGMKPSRTGIEYLTQIFTGAIGQDDVDAARETLFAPGNLMTRYHSVNTDVSKRIRYLDQAAVARSATTSWPLDNRPLARSKWCPARWERATSLTRFT